MKPEWNSEKLLSITRSKAKMIEYNIPERYQQIKIKTSPTKLFPLTIGLLGDYSHKVHQTGTTKSEVLELQNTLRFSSRFFDAFFQSMLDNDLNDYLVLLGSASYYLCDLPGHSTVLLRKLEGKVPDLDAGGLERLLFWLLSSDTVIEQGGKWEYFVQEISKSFQAGPSPGLSETSISDPLARPVSFPGFPSRRVLPA